MQSVLIYIVALLQSSLLKEQNSMLRSFLDNFRQWIVISTESVFKVIISLYLYMKEIPAIFDVDIGFAKAPHN